MKWVKAFRMWIRVVLPFEWAVLVWVGMQTLLYGVVAVGLLTGNSQLTADLWDSVSVVSGMTAGMYGVFRTWYFHPIENLAYGEWLQKTPWSLIDPLPLGPLNFVWQDAVILFAMGLLSPTPIVTLGVVLTFFVGGYCVSQAIFASFRREPVGAYGFFILLGVGIIGMMRLEVIVPIAIAMCIVAHISNRLLLHRFHEIDLAESTVTQAMSSLLFVLAPPDEGWPAGFLCRDGKKKIVTQIHAIGIALIASWLTYAMMWHFPIDPDNAWERTVSCAVGLSIYVILPRLYLYCWNYRPPMSILGRIATGKWFILGYDKVFVFAIVILAGWFAGYQLAQMGYDVRFSLALATGLVVWGTLGVGPALREWSMTGDHRIVPGLRKKKMFETL